mgnify:CR=1 FL=1
MTRVHTFFTFTILIFCLPKIALNSNLADSIDNPFREQSSLRDKYRNPLETLSFFGIEKNLKTLEITPGRGWYTEILANYYKDTENYYVAVYREPSLVQQIIEKIQKEFFLNFKNKQNQFGNFKTIFIEKNFQIENKLNYFDIILTFRNTHNFLDRGKAQKIYSSFHKLLKKGGILGIVQHRANESADFDFKKGYVKESFLIDFVENIGFKLSEKSEINSNPLDDKNYPKGVWTLPPRMAEGETNKDRYLKIGESDRMTLKFIKK